ncbi:peptidoglycan-binding protein [Parasedimentitalea marina]|uniref:Peptidoglycan-binding protein n=1 Tax=Parasedimentitalea marina TaxID=2483033 RepID=A0A3T0N568_9RHOB|nr:peptidoglycan-binding domain-containing protein [Parasedimentitalea marina]AZV79119.1 peptidoglycan-binding protein [Parasedimentitalea marina]
MTPIRPFLLAALLLGGLSACTPPGANSGGTVSRGGQQAPPGAAPDSCWGKQTTPAIIETVTHQVMLQPAEVLADGSVLQPAIFKTETRQDIVRPRQETWYEILCTQDLTPELIASVQRALTARDLYHGTISGEMDRATRAAVRRYQKPQGLNSNLLSLAAARQMGLVAIED